MGAERKPPADPRGRARRASCCRSAARCSSRWCGRARSRSRTTSCAHIGDARRQLAEQTLELRGLRGKNNAKVRLMIKRVDAETAGVRGVHDAAAGDARRPRPHAQGHADRPLVRPGARRGRGDAGVDGRVGAQPRREEGLPGAVRAAAQPARRGAAHGTARSGRCSRRRSAASMPSSASAWRRASRSTSTASPASCS